MNKEQIDKYIKNPDHCPFCGADTIDTADYGFEGTDEKGTEPFIWNECSCLSCNKQWKEIYTLKTIKDSSST